MNRHDLVRLRHMHDAVLSALKFAEGRTQSDLGEDDMLCFALIRALEIIGEAAAQISTETRNSYPNIPWKAMTGMRNRLIHAYFDVDLEILWQLSIRRFQTFSPN